MRIKKAFTMAEAILVMTILGIIATIMITTLKPAEFKEKGMNILSKKILSEIDGATTQIILNDSADGSFNKLYSNFKVNTSNFGTNTALKGNELGNLYKKYLTATRTACNNSADCPCYVDANSNAFFLKDGACLRITTGNEDDIKTILPGETSPQNKSTTYGSIFFDINGKEEPNMEGKDQFLLPLNSNGIWYD